MNRHKNAGPIMAQMQKTWRKLKCRKIVGIRGLCCGSCSASEGGNKMDEDESMVGYAYYHVQDRDNLDDYGHLYVGYGARDRSDEKTTIIGQQLYMLFAMDGFSVKWDGKSNTRLKISLPVTGNVATGQKSG
jgi:hypothetical protein